MLFFILVLPKISTCSSPAWEVANREKREVLTEASGNDAADGKSAYTGECGQNESLQERDVL